MKGKCVFWGFLIAALVMFLPAAGLAKGTTVIYGSSDKIESFDPANAIGIHGIEFCYNVQAMLFTFAEGSTEPVPDLIESYTVNDKANEYTFKLKQGIKFDDGTPFDAQVVKYSIDRHFKLNASFTFIVTRFVKEVVILSPYEVKFVLTGPCAFFPQILTVTAFAMVNPNIFPMDRSIDDPAVLGGKISGLGPYKLASFKRDEEMVEEARPNYHGQRAKNDRVIIRYFADPTTMRLALEKGELDLCYRNLNISDIVDLRDSGKYKFYPTKSPWIHYLSFLCTDPPFDNKVVRQGVGACINRAEINQKVNMGLSRSLYSMMGIDWWPYLPAFETAYGDGNVAKGKELLAQAGYNESNKLEFELWYTPIHIAANEAELATMIKNQLEATGVMEVSVRSVEFASFMEGLSKKAAQANVLSWIPQYVDVDGFFGSFASAELQVVLGSHYVNKDWLALTQAAAGELDKEKRAALYYKLQQDYTVEVPNVPLVESSFFAFSHQNVSGMEFTSGGCMLYRNIVRGE